MKLIAISLGLLLFTTFTVIGQETPAPSPEQKPPVAADEDDNLTLPAETEQEAEARKYFDQASAHIAADITQEMRAMKVPDDRRERISKMAIAAYQMNGNFPLWDNLKNQVKADREITELLKFNGLTKPLQIAPFADQEIYLNQDSPVATDDLRVTLRLAEACLLLKEGPHDLNIGWGEDWSRDDFAGEGDAKDQERRLAYNFAMTVAEQPDSQIGVAIAYVPQNWIYRRFIEQLIKMEGESEPPKIFVTKFVRAGDSLEQAKDLAMYLQEEGHLDEAGLEGVLSRREGVYTEALSQGIKSYQKSKGLDQDGILGPATAERLSQNHTIERNQVLLNLHRARFMPNLPGKRHILINLPSAKVYGLDQNKVTSEIRVVIGKDEVGKRTPIFRDQMEYVVFRPGESGRSTQASSLRRQYFSGLRKDSAVSKGMVNFLFPNNHSVFFHDSETGSSFRKNYRASSTGSMRVQEPEKLASWVLSDHEGWNGYSVQKAMKSGSNQWVKLKQPLAVYIVYFTAFPKTDKPTGIDFHVDYYNRDNIGQGALTLTGLGE